MTSPSALHRLSSSEKGLRPLLLSPPPAHLPPDPAETLRPLSLSLSQPYRPDAATDAVSPAPCSPSSTLPLLPINRQQRSKASSRTLFSRGGCNPALSSAAILVATTLSVSLVPAWIGFRVLKDTQLGGSNSNSTDSDLPPFWYLTFVGAFTSLIIGLVLGCIVGVRARYSEDIEITSGLTFLKEDWVARVAVAGCVVLGVFALPVGMGLFGHYRAVDGVMMEVVGLGIVFMLGVGGLVGYVIWHSVHDEWRGRKLLIGYKY